MNKTAIKNFAIWARNKLIADISYRAGLMGITEKGIADALPQSTGDTEFYDIGAAQPYSITGEAIRQRKKLVEVIRTKEKDTDYQTAYRYIMEEVAYTWFNRLIAVRFMEVNDYLPSHIRVLSSESGKLEPDLVTTPFDADLSFTQAEEAALVQLRQDNKLDEAFRLLFIKQCNALNGILPALFEKTKDYTELLLNLSVIDQEGVVYHLIHDIPEDDFNIDRGGQVEIIGWLYQYYNTEPKAAAFAKKEKITKEEIPAVTQLFTPDWIVRYMVENSLGRLWLEGHPDSTLKENWKYYLDEAPQEPEVQVKLAEIRKEYAALTPEDIKLIDPCMGSGHILVYAFDVLMQIYTSVGYSERDAARSILEHNLYGLDIDDRAYQLAYFAVMMKARQYNRRILNRENTCHVYAIQESNTVNRVHLKYFGAGLNDLEKNLATMQIGGLLDTLTDAKEYGSILNVENYNWELLRRFVAGMDIGTQINMDSYGVEDTAEQLMQLIDIGETMAQKYWVTVTNPPYAGTSNLSVKLNNYVKQNFPDSKSDLFAVLIERCNQYSLSDGFQAMITQHAWMFINSYENLRRKIYTRRFISLVHLGIKAFEEIGNDVVQTCVFVIQGKYIDNYCSQFVRLVDCKNYNEKEQEFLAGKHRFMADVASFKKIPGLPLAYWVSNRFIDNFKGNKYIEDYGILTGSQNITGDNEKYLRCFWEIKGHQVGKRWHFYAKGGDYRQYYGNLTFVVDWSDTARNFYETNKTSNLLSEEFWFKPGITYSAITSRGTGFRYLPEGCIFDKGGPSINLRSNIPEILALLNTNVAKYYFWVFNPSINLQVKDVKSFPIILPSDSALTEMAKKNLKLCEYDWNAYETSWEFKRHPLVPLSCEEGSKTVQHQFEQWSENCNARSDELRENEKNK